jgi:hypothetical protein
LLEFFQHFIEFKENNCAKERQVFRFADAVRLLYFRVDLAVIAYNWSVLGESKQARHNVRRKDPIRIGKKGTFINKFYVVRTVHFEMKLYNNQRNAQVFYLFPYLFLPDMFLAFFKPTFKGHSVQIRQWF